MLALGFTPHFSIEPLIYQIFASRRMTLTQQQQLVLLLLKGSLSETEQTLIDRLLYGVRHGLVKTKD